MTIPRSQLVSVSDTSYYHLVSRCVRRAFLCGVDDFSGKSFAHRKTWVVKRLEVLDSVFAVDLLAYAVMSNHYHLVVKIDVSRACSWSDREVAQRWRRLFQLPLVVDRWMRDGQSLSQTEQDGVETLIRRWRARLCDLSWYMRCLNEYLARQANAEDGCTGRFWEGRFKSQALLDEKAVLICMAYVDLNPIRAGIATTPETSAFTSIAQRIAGSNHPPLRALRGAIPSQTDPDLPFTLPEYLELVDWTGRTIRQDQRGVNSSVLPPILARRNIQETAWLDAMRRFPTRFHRAVGAADKIHALCARLKQRWLWGIRDTPLYHNTQPT